MGDRAPDLLLGAAVLGLVAAAGLWLWKKWALWLFGGLSLVLVGLDYAAGAPLAHKAAVFISTLIVLSLAYAVRQRFR